MRSYPVCFAVLFGSLVVAQPADLPAPVRIESGVGGHIHPALCVTKKGTWSPSTARASTSRTCSRARRQDMVEAGPVPAHGQDAGLSRVADDGRLVHAWNVWFALLAVLAVLASFAGRWAGT